MKIVVARNELQAAALFVSNDENRLVLNGVCIEVQKGRDHPVIVACNGPALVAINSRADQPFKFTKNYRMLLRADMLKWITATLNQIGGEEKLIEFDMEPGDTTLKFSITGPNSRHEVDMGWEMEGEYPNWRLCIPKSGVIEMPTSKVAINVKLVGKFEKVAKELGADYPIALLHLCGEDGLMEFKLTGLPENYLYALVQPCKPDEAVEWQPEFIEIVKDLPKPKAQEDEEKEAA